jgi:hypothetical protein
VSILGCRVASQSATILELAHSSGSHAGAASPAITQEGSHLIGCIFTVLVQTRIDLFGPGTVLDAMSNAICNVDSEICVTHIDCCVLVGTLFQQQAH